MGGITSTYAKINSVRYLWFAFYQTWYGVQGNDISELLPVYKDYQVKEGTHCEVQKDPSPCLQRNSSTDRVYITAISG